MEETPGGDCAQQGLGCGGWGPGTSGPQVRARGKWRGVQGAPGWHRGGAASPDLQQEAGGMYLGLGAEERPAGQRLPAGTPSLLGPSLRRSPCSVLSPGPWPLQGWPLEVEPSWPEVMTSPGWLHPEMLAGPCTRSDRLQSTPAHAGGLSGSRAPAGSVLGPGLHPCPPSHSGHPEPS